MCNISIMPYWSDEPRHRGRSCKPEARKRSHDALECGEGAGGDSPSITSVQLPTREASVEEPGVGHGIVYGGHGALGIIYMRVGSVGKIPRRAKGALGGLQRAVRGWPAAGSRGVHCTGRP